jgi:hypothetical protein
LSPALAAEEAVLDNACVRIVMRDSRIVSLLDKVRSLEHVAAAAERLPGLFQIQWVRGVQHSGSLDATEMAARVERRAGGEVEWAFEHAQASVRVRVALAGTPGESHWSLAVTPKDNALTVGQVAFPVIATPAAAGGADKKYLLPLFEGRLRSVRSSSLWRSYPSDLFAQMTACLGPAGGFLLWTDDGEGQAKSFGFERREGASEFAVRHLMAYIPGQAWTMPYRTRLSFCGGAWQDAADIYRDWATSQPWSGVAVRARRDLPDLLRHPPLCLSTQLDKEEAETLPDRLSAWGRRFGAPIIYRPLGWEKHGNWVGVDYFPPALGERRFQELSARLQERGVTLAGFISGYRWVTGSKELDAEANDELARYFREHGGPQVCERTRDGELMDFYGPYGHRICRGTPFGQGFLPATARQLFNLGVPIIHDDQDHGPYPGGVESCFDRSHGHPLPCGPWSTSSTRNSLREIRAEAARRGLSDFLITKESCSELLNMDLHGYQARFFHESTTPDLVPLCQYLFHERIPAIFGWVTAGSRDTWDLAAMLVYGQIPSLAFWGGTAKRPEDVAPEGVRLLDDYFAAMKTYAKDYLLYGRMRRPLISNIPARRKDVAPANGNKKGKAQVVTLPLVIQSAWDGAAGQVGVFAVNVQPEPAVLRVPVPGAGAWQAEFYCGSTLERTQQVAPEGECVWHVAPGRLSAIVFKPMTE